jgi:hypothetical protein
MLKHNLPVGKLVAAIHAAPTRLVLAITGGGSGAIGWLLEVPGASSTVLEAVVPYSEGSLARWLGGPSDQACSAPTARAMAMAAYCRARDYSPAPSTLIPPPSLAGIAATASLASDRPKRGPHRVHLAAQTAEATVTWSLELVKGRRSRAKEERLAARLVLNLVAEVCGIAPRLELDLLPEERVESLTTVALPAWRELLEGSRTTARHGGRPASSGETSGLIFPGAFHPRHDGHRRMVEVAEAMLGRQVEFEISIRNVDKPPLDYTAIEERLAQFAPGETVWLTRAPTFEEKSQAFPGATFVVGADTIRRIADPGYYGSPSAMREALERIAGRGCRFLVFGRLVPAGFVRLADLPLPPPLDSISQEVPAERFREDISSTELRRGQES